MCTTYTLLSLKRNERRLCANACDFTLHERVFGYVYGNKYLF